MNASAFFKAINKFFKGINKRKKIFEGKRIIKGKASTI